MPWIVGFFEWNSLGVKLRQTGIISVQNDVTDLKSDVKLPTVCCNPVGQEVGAVRADLATLLVAVCVKIGLTLFSFHKLVFATMRDILQKSPPCLFSFPVRERKCSADGVLLVSFPQGLYLITTLY